MSFILTTPINTLYKLLKLMKNPITTDFYGFIVLKRPIAFEDLTVYGCLYNDKTDFKEIHNFFCYLKARKSFILNGGIVDNDEEEFWHNDERDLAFKCTKRLTKFFEFLYGNKVKCDIFEVAPYETISYNSGEVELDNIIVNNQLIERYKNNMSEYGRE